ESPNGYIDAVVEVHNRVIGPKLPFDFLAGYDLTLAIHEHSQDLKGLFPEKDLALTAWRPDRIEFTGPEI
ncbi:MAG TPA: hypothetical protein VNO24_20055, partial [Blastocatellia bacterium]|nr:hypothetical protein [Blastocatellia bacterium]